MNILRGECQQALAHSLEAVVVFQLDQQSPKPFQNVHVARTGLRSRLQMLGRLLQVTLGHEYLA